MRQVKMASFWSCLTLVLTLSVTMTTTSGLPKPRQSNVDQLPKDVRFKDGDLMLGLIAHVRGYSVDPVCGEHLAPLAMYTIPTAVDYATKMVNAMEDVLPNVTVGYVMFDDCMRDIPVVPRILQVSVLKCASVTIITYSCPKCKFFN